MVYERLIDLNFHYRQISSAISQERTIYKFVEQNKVNLQSFTDVNSFMYNDSVYVNLKYEDLDKKDNKKNDAKKKQKEVKKAEKNKMALDFHVTTPIWKPSAIETLKNSGNFMDDLCTKFVEENKFLDKFFDENKDRETHPSDVRSILRERNRREGAFYLHSHFFTPCDEGPILLQSPSHSIYEGLFLTVIRNQGSLSLKVAIGSDNGIEIPFIQYSLSKESYNIEQLMNELELVNSDPSYDEYGCLGSSSIRRDVVSDKILSVMLDICRNEVYAKMETLLDKSRSHSSDLIRYIFNLYIIMHTYKMSETASGNTGSASNYEISDFGYEILPEKIVENESRDLNNLPHLFFHNVMSKDVQASSTGSTPAQNASKFIPSRVIAVFAQDGKYLDVKEEKSDKKENPEPTEEDKKKEKELKSKLVGKYLKQLRRCLKVARDDPEALAFSTSIKDFVADSTKHDPENKETGNLMLDVQNYFDKQYISVGEIVRRGCNDVINIMNPKERNRDRFAVLVKYNASDDIKDADKRIRKMRKSYLPTFACVTIFSFTVLAGFLAYMIRIHK